MATETHHPRHSGVEFRTFSKKTKAIKQASKTFLIDLQLKLYTKRGDSANRLTGRRIPINPDNQLSTEYDHLHCIYLVVTFLFLSARTHVCIYIRVLLFGISLNNFTFVIQTSLCPKRSGTRLCSENIVRNTHAIP